MTSPFDYLKAINQTKEDILEDEKDYNQFMVNRGLSFFADTIFYANEVNMLQLDNRLHFDYLINIIRSRKRYSKWFKKSEDEDIKSIMEYYQVNPNRAIEISSILSLEQKQVIKDRLKKE